VGVRIVTDSTADLSPDLAASLNIAVVPLNVHFGEQVYRDGLDISADEFYSRLKTSSVFPRTSQPSAGAFAEAYERLTGWGFDVVSIHISAKLSGTCNSAFAARASLSSNRRIELVDSQYTSLAQGMIVLAAARAADSGAEVEEVLRVTADAMSRTQVRFTVDTLEYLWRGGRIGKAQRLMGALLNVKPIMTIIDGEIHPQARVRSRSRALDHLFEFATDTDCREAAIVHAACAGEAERFRARLAPKLHGRPLYVAQFGPVLGAYAGPGAVALALLTSRRLQEP